MRVKELIELLKLMDQNAKVRHLWDGELRTAIERVYMGKTGICVTADFKEYAYSDAGRPKAAPNQKEKLYWGTRDKGEER